jgi:hypothetical protein
MSRDIFITKFSRQYQSVAGMTRDEKPQSLGGTCNGENGDGARFLRFNMIVKGIWLRPHYFPQREECRLRKAGQKKGSDLRAALHCPR